MVKIVWPNISELNVQKINIESDHVEEITSVITQDGELLEIINPVVMKESVESILMELDGEIKTSLNKQLAKFLDQIKNIEDFKGLFDQTINDATPVTDTENINQINFLHTSTTQIIILSLKIIITGSMEEISKLPYEDSFNKIKDFQEKISSTLSKLLRLKMSIEPSLQKTFFIKITDCISILTEYKLLITNMLCDDVGLYNLWERYPKYITTVDKEDITVKVNVFGYSVDYGFDLCGNLPEDFSLGNLNEYDLLNIMSCMDEYSGAICYTDRDEMSDILLSNIANSLGKEFYIFESSKKMNEKEIIRAIKLHYLTDCWVCIRNVNRLSEDIKNIIENTFILKTKGNSEGTISLCGEKIPIDRKKNGYLFLTQDRLIPKFSSKTNYLKTPVVFSSLTDLSPEMTRYMRLITIRQIPFLVQIRFMLCKEGFQNFGELSTMLLEFIMIVENHFTTQIDDKDGISGKFLSNTLILDLGVKIRSYLLQLFSDENFGKIEFEKKILVASLKEEFQHVLSTGNRDNFLKILQDFWKANNVDLNNFTEIKKESEDKVMKEDLFYENLKESLLINNNLKICIKKILNSLEQKKPIGIIGSAGVGKSTFIETALRMKTELTNVEMVIDKIYPDSFSDGYLFSKDYQSDLSLLQTVLSKFSKESQCRSSMAEFCLVIDGNHSLNIIESLNSCLAERLFVLSNGNRIKIPASLHVIFELESVGDIHPGFVSQIALIHCENKILDPLSNEWKIPFFKILKSLPKKDELLKCLENLIPRFLKRIEDSLQKSVINFNLSRNSNDKSLVPLISQSHFGSLASMANYMKCIMSSNSLLNLDQDGLNNLVAYAALWAFGGFIKNESKSILSEIVKEIFQLNIPQEYQYYSLFDLYLDLEKMKWHPWSDLVSSNVLIKDNGLALDRIVKTATIEACNANLSLLSDNGFPVLLIGEKGCGKTALIKERLKALCSGEVAEVLNISIGLNIYTTSQSIATKLNENLQWQFGNFYTPVGNKKLIIFLDDFNASIKNYDGGNSINEFSRELLDSGSFWGLEHPHGGYDKRLGNEYTKKYVKNINMIATLSTEKLILYNKRLLRHFNIINLATESAEEQKAIFSTLVKGHLFGSSTGKPDIIYPSHHPDSTTPTFIDQLVNVTIDLQERLNHQFKSIAKPPHYYFNLHSLVQFFHNLCQSVSSNTDIKTFLHLWRNECFWTYKYRLIDPLHSNKYNEAYEAAVKGEFAEKYKTIDIPLQIMLEPKQSICSSIRMLDTGLVTTNFTKPGTDGPSDPRNSGSIKNPHSKQNADTMSSISTETFNQNLSYVPVKNVQKLTKVIQSALNEYNKIYPAINIHLHSSNVNVISRLSRLFTFNQNMGHCLVVSDGSPGLSTILLKLSAHIAGFRVTTSSSEIINSHDYTVDMFKTELNALFTNTGSKGEKLVLLIRDNDLSIPGVTQCIRDFIISMSIDELFTVEQKTHIINAVRTEVVRSGLNYSREVAWKFFIQNVVKNFRFAIVANDCHSMSFHAWMQHNTHLIGKMNVLWNVGWSKQELINNGRYILDSYVPLKPYLSDNDKENCCYLLQSIHTASQDSDVSKHNFKDYDHIDKSGLAVRNQTNNTIFERFVLKFCQLLEKRFSIIEKGDIEVTSVLSVINEQEGLATRLHSQLTHEKQVLQDKVDAATSILNQIGENTVIVHTQMKTIQAQINEITQLKKLVPEYKLAHDRFSYKSIAAFNKAREVVKNLDIDNLTELRSIHTPSAEVSELIGTVIMILKSPNVDMSWNTGGKRLLANLERFTVELLTFDERKISDETLAILHPLLKKSTMEPEIMMEKSQMSSCRDLCSWVHHVTQYYKIMQNKVNPLHHKLENTAKEVADAEIQMKLLDEKRKNLNSRLQDLSNNFEQATLDRYNQEIKSAKVTEMLTTSENLIGLLAKEKTNANFLKNFYKSRKTNVFGSCCVAAGFITYLGRFSPLTRRELLTVDWPRCLRERGLNLTFDSVDKSRGLKIIFDYPDLQPDTNKQVREVKNNEEEVNDDQSVSTFGSKVHDQIPLLTNDQYSSLIQAIGSYVLDKVLENDLSIEDFSDLELQQTILLVGNPDRLAVIHDPSGYGKSFYTKNSHFFNGFENGKLFKHTTLQTIDTENSSSQQLFSKLEEAITKGQHIIIETRKGRFDSFIESLLLYFSFQSVINNESDSRFIQIGTRRLIPDPKFRAVIISKDISSDRELQSQVNLINGQITESHLLDIVADKCFSFAGNNFEIIQSSRLMNERHQYYLKFLKQELSSLLINTNGTKDQLWNDENLELLKCIVDVLHQIDLKLTQYDQFKNSVNKNKNKFRKQFMRLELIIQCVKNMERINSNISVTPSSYLELFDNLLVENKEVSFKNLNAKDVDNINPKQFDPRGKTSIVKIDFVKNHEDILKWSVHDELPNFEINEEDDKRLVDELLISIDTEEKKLLAQDITGVRSSKHHMKLKSFESYMKRRGVLQVRKWKPDINSKNDNIYSSIRNTERSETSNKLKQIKMIVSEIELDIFNEAGKSFSILSEEGSKKILVTFESNIINRLKLCLTKEEFKIYRFIYYLWLSEDPINAPNSFELEFFIHGSLKPQMKLSLQDFGCSSPNPNWISVDMWNEILAASLVPGPLEELAVKVAENSEEWKRWYQNEDVEDLEWTPLNNDKKQDDSDNSIHLSPNRFINLILLRIFKPDRCKSMIESISESKMSADTYNNDIDSILKQSPKIKCILVVQSPEPSSDLLSIDKFDYEDCLDFVETLSKTKSKSLSYIPTSTINDSLFSSLLENDFKNSDWIVLTNLGNDSAAKLKITDMYLKKLVSNGNDLKTSLLWIICKESSACLNQINIEHLDHVLVLSEISLKEMCQQNSINSSESVVLEKVFSTILTAFHSQKTHLIKFLNQNQPLSSKVLWNMVLLNGIMMLRQVLGCRGVATWKKMPTSIFRDQLSYLSSKDLESLSKNITNFINDIINIVFVKVYFDSMDLIVIKSLGNLLFSNLMENEIMLNNLEINMPVFNSDISVNMESLRLQMWFKDKNISLLTFTEEESSEYINTSATFKYIGLLERFLNSFLQLNTKIITEEKFDDKYISKMNKKIWSLSTNKLRAKTIFVSENLPPLIDSKNLNLENFQFNYNASTSLTLASDPSNIEKSYLIEKEWKTKDLFISAFYEETQLFNREVCKIRSQLHLIFNTFEEDFIDLPECIVEICCSLIEESVPQQWILLSQTSYVPTTHRLTTYVEYFNKRYRQLLDFYKKIYQLKNKSEDLRLESIWLGGLKKPNAILEGLITNYALNTDISLNKIQILGLFSTDNNEDSIELRIKDLFIIGAEIDFINQKIIISKRCTLKKISRMYLKLIVLEDSEILQYYKCPVYADQSRNKLVSYILLRCDGVKSLCLSGIFIVLDIGSDVKENRKEKIPVLIPPSINLQETASPNVTVTRKLYEENMSILYTLREEDEGVLVEEDATEAPVSNDTSNRTDQMNPSSSDQKSQLSFRPSSPNGPPIPPELEISREKKNLLELNQNNKSDESNLPGLSEEEVGELSFKNQEINKDTATKTFDERKEMPIEIDNIRKDSLNSIKSNIKEELKLDKEHLIKDEKNKNISKENEETDEEQEINFQKEVNFNAKDNVRKVSDIQAQEKEKDTQNQEEVESQDEQDDKEAEDTKDNVRKMPDIQDQEKDTQNQEEEEVESHDEHEDKDDKDTNEIHFSQKHIEVENINKLNFEIKEEFKINAEENVDEMKHSEDNLNDTEIEIERDKIINKEIKEEFQNEPEKQNIEELDRSERNSNVRELEMSEDEILNENISEKRKISSISNVKEPTNTGEMEKNNKRTILQSESRNNDNHSRSSKATSDSYSSRSSESKGKSDDKGSMSSKSKDSGSKNSDIKKK